MMANNDMSRWCVLYTAPKSERKLVQRLHAAGYMAFCPMQIVFNLKSASNLNGNLNCSKELEHYAS